MIWEELMFMLRKLYRKINDWFFNIVRTPVTLRLMRGGMVLAEVNSSEWENVNDGNWHFGSFRWNPKSGRFVCSLGIQTNLVRDGKTFAVGWTGEEEHVATFCDPNDGDIFRYVLINGGFFKGADRESLHPDIVVVISNGLERALQPNCFFI